MTRDSAAPAAPDLPEELAAWAGEAPPADGDQLTLVRLDGPAWPRARVRGLRMLEVAIAGGDLGRAGLDDPTLRDVLADDANLANATVRGGLLHRVAVARGRLTGITFAEVELRDVAFTGCAADMAAFRHCTLERVTFEGCSLAEADFTGARCEAVRFWGCDLTAADFATAEMARCELRRCRVEGLQAADRLRGTAVDAEAMMALAPAMAAALGIRLLED